jgi:hypothetical protein
MYGKPSHNFFHSHFENSKYFVFSNENIFLNKSHVNITIIKRNFIKLRLTFYFARKKKLKVYKNIDQNYSLIGLATQLQVLAKKR